jgi:hypothetical protein
MTHAYINYPNPRITLHGKSSCSDIGKMGKSIQRHVRVDDSSVSAELQRFRAKSYRFSADATANDMWLEVDFDDAAFERAVVAHIHRLISVHYKPFATVTVEPHCG